MKKFLYVFLTILAAVLVFIVISYLFILNKGKGALQITSNPNSKVYLNDKLVGVTPLCKCDLKDMLYQGSYTLKLVPQSGSANPFEQTVTISPKTLTVVDKNFAEKGLGNASIISLSSIDNKNDAQIAVVTSPSGAQVFLDSKLQGVSPQIIKNVKESDHELEVSYKGYKDKIIRVRSVLGYKLEALIYLGIDPDFNASSSALTMPSELQSGVKSNTQAVLILQTPTGFLRVRQDASLSAAEISQVKPGETYELLDEKTGWYEIKLSDGSNGWISSQYAQKHP